MWDVKDNQKQVKKIMFIREAMIIKQEKFYMFCRKTFFKQVETSQRCARSGKSTPSYYHLYLEACADICTADVILMKQ